MTKKEVKLEQSEWDMLIQLNKVVLQTKAALMHLDDALQANISSLELKYNAKFNRDTGKFEVADKEEKTE